MTPAERIYRLALRAYPSDYRRARGDEILATLEEMGGGSAGPSMRQVAALGVCGLRERALRVTGGTRVGVWAEGCRLAALVLLVLAATASVFPIVLDTWYSRLGFVWPSTPFTAAPAMGAGTLARSLAAVLLPAVAAAAVCRGRTLLPMACALLSAALFLAGQLGSGIQSGQYSQLGQQWLVNAYALGDAVFLAAPAALLVAGMRRGGEPAAQHSLIWLAAPVLLGVLRIGFFATSLTFWPLGALLVAWFLCARWSPHLAVAALGVLAPTLAYLVPTAIGDASTYEYAVAVTAGATVLACASLATALAYDDDAAPALLGSGTSRKSSQKPMS
ncbi:MAG TPA: hypothetical protein VE777_11260 [Gaiellales bacterium]|nr:hypothetical protein [Gaiellales bacterium]